MLSSSRARTTPNGEAAPGLRVRGRPGGRCGRRRAAASRGRPGRPRGHGSASSPLGCGSATAGPCR
eukprot:12556945-Alexandrium_andersonii.AAC.1